MVEKPFTISVPYTQYARGLARLHELIAANLDDSPEGDAVRGYLDGPWRLLTSTEKKRIDGLAEDLYSLSDPVSQPRARNPQVQRKIDELFEAKRNREWDHALAILRRWHRYLDPVETAFLRGSIWAQAGDASIAALFLGHASQLAPADGTLARLYLHALGESDPPRALSYAHNIISSEARQNPQLIVQAGVIIALATRRMDSSEAESTFKRIIPILENVLKGTGIGSIPGLLVESDYLGLLGLLSLCHDRVGDEEAATSYLSMSLSVDPDNEFLRLRGGIRRYGKVPASVDDFIHTIQRGTTSVWPYYFLAHWELTSGNYSECKKLCVRALELEAPDLVRGDLYEWLAISRAMLEQPAQMVRSNFEAAVRLAPDSTRIRRNFDVFESNLNGSPNSSRRWAVPRASAIQEVGEKNYLPLAA
jgi:tetratricopeptide (TPR) repeat protein